jgi:RNA polymerase sigma factor (TIGR02999 family)
LALDPVFTGPCTREQLLSQLRVMALMQFSREQAGHTLQPTAVVHEAWIRIAAQAGDSLESEAKFRQWAGRVVREVLIDYARKRHAEKRDVRRRVPMGDAAAGDGLCPMDLITLSDLLDRLALTQPRMASVVEMKYFGGMRDADIGLRLGVTDRTVRADWQAARAWLYGKLHEL